MSDLVNRKTLIGAIEKCGEEKIYPQALIETIKALPSADAVSREEYNKLLEDLIWQSEHIGEMFECIDDCVTEMCDRQKVNSAEWVAEKEKEFEELHRPDYSYEADMVRRLKDALSADRPKGECDDKPEPYVPEASTERVVHCKDCIYSRQPEEELFVCENRFGMSGWVRENEFCSSGSL